MKCKCSNLKEINFNDIDFDKIDINDCFKFSEKELIELKEAYNSGMFEDVNASEREELSEEIKRLGLKIEDFKEGAIERIIEERINTYIKEEMIVKTKVGLFCVFELSEWLLKTRGRY